MKSSHQTSDDYYSDNDDELQYPLAQNQKVNPRRVKLAWRLDLPYRDKPVAPTGGSVGRARGPITHAP